jgi:hypothetical protein
MSDEGPDVVTQLTSPRVSEEVSGSDWPARTQ